MVVMGVNKLGENSFNSVKKYLLALAMSLKKKSGFSCPWRVMA